VLSTEDWIPSFKRKKEKSIFTQVMTFLETVVPDKVFSKTVFNISKILSDIEKMYKIE